MKRQELEHGISRGLNQCKKGAKERDIDFSLTRDQYKSLILQPCFYCKQPPKPYKRTTWQWNTKNGKHYKQPYNYYRVGNTIDRVDSSKGYLIGNVVACCVNCNVAKSDMTLSEFVTWIKRVHKNLRGIKK